jgi:outer membrane protein with beta-barrel domain
MSWLRRKSPSRNRTRSNALVIQLLSLNYGSGGTSVKRLSVWLLLVWLCLPSRASGQFFAGAQGGVSTLSADARSVIAPVGASFSLYKPENGATATLFLGRHLTDYLSLQADYGWNRNDLMLSATTASPQGQTLYQEARQSSEQSFLGNLLLYFRNRRGWARPYLSVGTGIVRFHSRQVGLNALMGAPTLPPPEFSSVAMAVRVPVGIDITIRGRWAFRYTFRETIRSNPISARLSPPGQRNLATFENLFGIVKTF